MTRTPCSYYEPYKAKYKPRCNCFPCWEKWFLLHRGVVYSAMKIKRELGKDGLVKIEGEKFVKALLIFEEEISIKGHVI